MPCSKPAVPEDEKAVNRATVPRPNIRCRRPADGQDVLAPGLLIETPDGAAVVFVGDIWPDPRIDLRRLAARLRTARTVDLVGDVWQACRPLKQALRDQWTELTREARAARKAATPPAPPKAPPKRCGQPRKDGEPCRQTAGWGCDTPGTGPCFHHGGSTARMDAELRQRREHAQLLADLAKKAASTELTREERIAAATALRQLLKAGRRRRTT